MHLPPTPAPRVRIESTLRPLIRIGLPFAIFFVAAALLGTGLDDPPAIVFDEAHYIHWSREIARGTLVTDGARIPQSPVNYEHPPFAKHLMAASHQLLGTGQLDLTWEQYEHGCAKEGANCPAGRTWEGCDHPNPACKREALGWRLPSMLVGSSAVAGVYLLALRLFNSVPAGLFASALLLLDTLWYLQTRMAMLDVFAAGFTVWAFALLLGRGILSRVLATLPMAAALASKNTALFLLPLFALVQLARTRPGSSTRRILIGVLLGLAVPLAGFVASYAPYLAIWYESGGAVKAVQRFVYVQIAGLSWDYSGTFQHDSSSPAWAWVPHLNPTFYYWPGFDRFTQDNVLRPPFIYAVGNVALWWPATGALVLGPVVLATRWIRTTARLYLRWDFLQALPRQAVHLTTSRSLAFAMLLFWASFLPFFLLRRTTFNYYATFIVPYFAVVAAGLLHLAWRAGPRGRALAVVYLALVGGWFTLWWPAVSGAPADPTHFEAMWSVLPWMKR